jgi:predicted DNA binding protein
VTYSVSDDASRAMYEPVKVINDKTGEVSFTNSTGDITYKKRTRIQQSTRMYETDDANTLVSEAKHPKELAYADYANSMKALGNKARAEMMNTGKIEYSASAKQTYRAEVDSLMSKLNTALLNASRERAAQRAANASVNAKKKADPDMKKEDIKKAGQQALSANRALLGSVSRRDRNIKITDREWEAIQAGAISENTLKQILNNTDTDVLRQRATPRASTTLSNAKIAKLKTMSASNKYSLAEMASALGVSTSTVSNYLKGEN